MRKLVSLLALGVSILCGPAFAQAPPAPAQPPPIATVQETAAALTPEEALTYRLGPGDKLRILTYDELQLTGEFFVDSSGTVTLPLIGAVQASGRTVAQVRDDVESMLKNGYIKNPSVSIEVLTFRPFFILGEVNKPGEYPYTSGLTVLEAVATAGGFTYRANEGRVYIKHSGETSERKVPLSASTSVRAGDTIRITERYF